MPDARGRPRISISEDRALASRIPPETKNGDHVFSLERSGVIPKVLQVAPYLDRFRLGVNRGRMNSCAMAENTRSASLMPNAIDRSPVPRFELG